MEQLKQETGLMEGIKKKKKPGLLWPNFSILDLLESPGCSEKQDKSVWFK